MRRISKKDIQLIEAFREAVVCVSPYQMSNVVALTPKAQEEFEEALQVEAKAREALLKHILKLRNAQDDWMKD